MGQGRLYNIDYVSSNAISGGSIIGDIHIPTDYVVYRDGSTYYAKDARNGEITTSNAQCATVMNAVCNENTKVYVPSGNYVLNAAVYPKEGCTIQGAGLGTYFNVNAQVDGFHISGVKHVTLRDFEVEASWVQHPYSGSLIKLSSWSGANNAVEHCFIDNLRLDGGGALHSGALIHLYASGGTPQAGVSVSWNTFSNIYGEAEHRAIYLENDTENDDNGAFINGNSFYNLKFQTVRIGVEFDSRKANGDIPGANGRGKIGYNRFKNVIVENDSIGLYAFRNIIGANNEFITCYASDWKKAVDGGNAVHMWEIHPSAVATTINTQNAWPTGAGWYQDSLSLSGQSNWIKMVGSRRTDRNMYIIPTISSQTGIYADFISSNTSNIHHPYTYYILPSSAGVGYACIEGDTNKEVATGGYANAAIQYALDNCTKGQDGLFFDYGGHVKIAPGLFYISSVLEFKKRNTILEGSGRGTQIRPRTQDAESYDCIHISGTASGQYAHLRDISLYSGNAGVRLENTNWVTLENVTAVKNNYGILISGQSSNAAYNVLITDCIARNNKIDGMRIDADGGGAVSIVGGNACNNTNCGYNIKDCAGGAIYNADASNNQDGFCTSGARDFTLYNCYAESNTRYSYRLGGRFTQTWRGGTTLIDCFANSMRVLVDGDNCRIIGGEFPSNSDTLSVGVSGNNCQIIGGSDTMTKGINRDTSATGFIHLSGGSITIDSNLNASMVSTQTGIYTHFTSSNNVAASTFRNPNKEVTKFYTTGQHSNAYEFYSYSGGNAEGSRDLIKFRINNNQNVGHAYFKSCNVHIDDITGAYAYPRFRIETSDTGDSNMWFDTSIQTWIVGNNTAGDFYISDYSSNSAKPQTYPFKIDAGAVPTDTLFLDSGSGDGGRVGINDSSPEYNLDVGGGSDPGGSLRAYSISSDSIIRAASHISSATGIYAHFVSANASNLSTGDSGGGNAEKWGTLAAGTGIDTFGDTIRVSSSTHGSSDTVDIQGYLIISGNAQSGQSAQDWILNTFSGNADAKYVASGVTLNAVSSQNMAVADRIYHLGDTDNDTYIRFTENQISLYGDGRELLRAKGVGSESNYVMINPLAATHEHFIASGNSIPLIYADVVDDRVGVGTNSPSYLLDVNGTTNTAALSSQAISGAWTTPLYKSKPTASDHKGEIIRVSGATGEATWLFISVKDSADAWNWMQLGLTD